MASLRLLLALTAAVAAPLLAFGCATGGEVGLGGAGPTSATSTTGPTTSSTDATSTTSGGGFGGFGGFGGSGGAGPGPSSSSVSSSTSASSSSTAASSSSTSASSSSTSSSSSSTSASSSSGGTCGLAHLVISEIRSRGAGGANDEFVELYNPTAAPVTLDAQWKIEARSSSSTSYGARWTGTGKAIPAHGHFLIVGSTYTQMPAGDESLSTGITDATSLRLVNAGATVDAVCYAFDTTTQMAFADATYTCEGAPASNLPHNNGTSAASNSDASMERKPCTDTGDNASDFAMLAPAMPESTQSPPVP